MEDLVQNDSGGRGGSDFFPYSRFWLTNILVLFQSVPDGFGTDLDLIGDGFRNGMFGGHAIARELRARRHVVFGCFRDRSSFDFIANHFFGCILDRFWFCLKMGTSAAKPNYHEPEKTIKAKNSRWVRSAEYLWAWETHSITSRKSTTICAASRVSEEVISRQNCRFVSVNHHIMIAFGGSISKVTVLKPSWAYNHG